MKPQESWISVHLKKKCFVFIVCISVLKYKGISLSRKGGIYFSCADFALVMDIYAANSHPLSYVIFVNVFLLLAHFNQKAASQYDSPQEMSASVAKSIS